MIKAKNVLAPLLYGVEASDDLLATGTIWISSDLRVLTCNGSAQALILGKNYQSKPVLDLISDAEKFGICAAGTRNAFAAMLVSGSTQFQFEMRDGRTIMARARMMGEATLVELSDVSFVVRSALSQHRDPLTGLATRVELLTRLSQAMEDTEKSAHLLYLDLDRFKAVNDTLGHPVGDALLKLVADRIGNILSAQDIIARLGGDEFAVLLAEVDHRGAAEVFATKLIDVVSRSYLAGGHLVNIGVSVGIAVIGQDGNNPDEIIKNADLALFCAKSEGRGTYRFFTSEMDRQSQERRDLEVDIRRALAMREFSLAYQPQYEISGRHLLGFEALLRWQHEVRGDVSPASFIPLAEHLGLIVPLGEWVLRTACSVAAAWPPHLSIAVNISPLQFRTEQLVSTVASALADSGLAPERLELEITEGALLEYTDTVISVLTKIKSTGVRISMDDFGTGYSSLSYLQKFPFDKIKIDQSFVRKSVTDPDSAAIVRAVSALGESLGMTTIAEGVETEEQLTQIFEQGCRQVQGFLTGRPMNAEAVSALIQQSPL
ncbi:putative bifunctional diguanylate cyclase/phosphodiesterase [Devosia psychrophila]|uniref:Diguanylate cyclase (GGDEF) domain-containing protein n=1 Tax=Devosia psychrophila TaxID=728005 RepID=A0A1I1N499_9HYPH|nr:EAL domain-containing protein [Devosia psychrophila]SFC90308.1 diguanylate cyclase (GGDEF) domain-containing protein [Devosia psychrophila]